MPDKEAVEDDVDRLLLREASARYPQSEFSNAEKMARYADDLEAFQVAMIQSSVSARDRELLATAT